MIKKSCVLLTVIIILFNLVACSGGTSDVSKGEGEGDSSKLENGEVSPPVKNDNLTAEEWIKTLPDYNYNGYEVLIVTSRQNTFAASDETDSETINRAIETRNELAEEKYNIKIKETVKAESIINTELNTSINAGLFYSDLLCVTAYSTSLFASQGYLNNLNSVPFFDSGAEYHNTGIIKASTGNNTLYAVYDELTFYQENAWVIYYNKGLVSENNDPVALYKEGNWTWDRLRNDAEAIAKEVMDKKTADTEIDVFGFGSVFEKDEFIYSLWMSSGLKIFGDTYLKELNVSVDYNQANNVIAKIKEITGTRALFSNYGKGAYDAFEDGRLGYLIGSIEYMKSLKVDNIDWGMVAMPKLLENQNDYYTYLGKNAYGISVPLNQSDSARTGNIFNVLCAASYEHMNDEFVLDYVHRYLPDNDSAVQMNHIIEDITTDISSLYYFGFDSLANVSRSAVLKAVNGDVQLENAISENYSSFKLFLETKFK